MSNLARKIHRDEGHEGVNAGVIVRVAQASFVVRTARGDLDARRAVSCVVAPELHDEVLVAEVGDGRAYVLAVLEREEGARARLVFEGDVDIEAPRGRVGMKAAGGVAITSGRSVDVTAGELNVSALGGNVVLQKLSYVGSVLRAEVESIKTFAASCDQVLERFTQHVRRSYRKVEEIDEVKAKEIHYTASDNVFVSGENTVVTAEELVKVDGAQIHIG
jgi:hypothetical protein